MAKTRDMFADRRRQEMDFGADSSVIVTDVFQTGMNIGQQNPRKWVLLGMNWGPANLSDIPDALGADCALQIQFALGEHAAQIDADDSQLICQQEWQVNVVGAAGVQFESWPHTVPILSPIPIFANELTVMLQCSINDTAFQNLSWYYELVYVWRDADDLDISDFLAAYGTV